MITPLYCRNWTSNSVVVVAFHYYLFFNIARRCQRSFYIDLFSAVQTHLPVRTWIERKRKRPDDVLPPQAQHVVSSVPRCLVFIKGELMHDDGKLLFEMLLYQIQYKHIWYVILKNHQHTVTVYYAVCHTFFFFFVLPCCIWPSLGFNVESFFFFSMDSTFKPYWTLYG